MKATKEYYLRLRSTFLQMGYGQEVKKLDNHFNLVLIYNKNGKLKYIK
jgi:hypothetical protein